MAYYHVMTCHYYDDDIITFPGAITYRSENTSFFGIIWIKTRNVIKKIGMLNINLKRTLKITLKITLTITLKINPKISLK